MSRRLVHFLGKPVRRSIIVLGPMIWAVASQANTPGRAWAPTEILQSTIGPMRSPRLDVDSTGTPILFGSMPFGSSPNVVGYRWGGNTWIESWYVGKSLVYTFPVMSPPNTYFVVGQEVKADALHNSWFWIGEKVGDEFATENIVKSTLGSVSYSGAVSNRRRWVTFDDFSTTRLFYSDQPGVWSGVSIGQHSTYGTSLIALNDTSVMEVFASPPVGLRWGTLQGSAWVLGEDLLGGGLSLTPQLRRRAAGGIWLGYGTKESTVLIRVFENGVWGSPIGVTANYVDEPEAYNSDAFEMSRDGYAFPALAWSAFNSLRGVDNVFASVPTDSGWTAADELPDDVEGIAPTVARDFNGDVWAAFWRNSRTGMFITHTYTKATGSIPSITRQGADNLVRWTLSESAPETWWAVLRSVGGGDYAPIARVRAGSSQQLSYLDGGEGAAIDVQYRVRRESVDKRYEWLSDPSDTPVPALATLASAIAQPGQVDLSWYSSQAATAVVYRRTAETDWVSVGSANSQGDGLLTFTDRTVTQGRYAYRLGLGQAFTPDTWVDVPSGFTLALEGFRPNPVPGPCQVAFTLAGNAPASLELYSVNGRRILAKEVGSMGMGNHVIDLTAADTRPGVYWVRISQAGKVITKKGVVTSR